MRRLGTSETVRVTCRVVAATNRDLEAAVASGGSAKISSTACACSKCASRRCGNDPATCRCSRNGWCKSTPHDTAARSNRFLRRRSPFSPDTRSPATCANSNTFWNALSCCRPATSSKRKTSPSRRTGRPKPAAPPGTLAEAVAALERTWIQRALEEADNVQLQAARTLGISERVLRYKLKRLGIRP